MPLGRGAEKKRHCLIRLAWADGWCLGDGVAEGIFQDEGQ